MNFHNFFSQGLLPVIVNGEEFNSLSIESIKRTITRNIDKQYSLESSVRADTVNFKEVVLMVDDFESSLKSSRDREQFLKCLESLFEYIIITTNDTFFFEGCLLSDKNSTVLEDYRIYEIIRFGRLLRKRLTEKWVLIRAEYQSVFEQQRDIDLN